MVDSSHVDSNVITNAVDSSGATVISVIQSNVTESSRVDSVITTGGKGNKGDTGPQGAAGASGSDGEAATITVGTVTTGDPGTDVIVSNSGSDSAAVLDFTIPQGETGASGSGTGDASTNTSSSVDSEVALFSGTGGKTLKRATGSGIAKLASGVLSIAINTDLPVGDATHSGAMPTPPNNTSTFLRGDATWATPSGGGDVSSNTATSVDSEIALFNSTTGKSIKRASISGIAKLASGVLSAATAGTDYTTPAGTENLTNKTLSTGSTIDASVTVTEVLKKVYPVGSIYFNISDSTNPGTLLGFGTWSAFAAGQVPVGFNSGDPDFGTVGATGGTKTVDISHTHSYSSSHSHPLSSAGRAEIYLSATKVIANQTTDTSWSRSISGTTTASTDTGAATNSTILTGNTDNGTASGTTGVSGSSTQSILQPFITVYMWKRTA